MYALSVHMYETMLKLVLASSQPGDYVRIATVTPTLMRDEYALQPGDIFFLNEQVQYPSVNFQGFGIIDDLLLRDRLKFGRKLGWLVDGDVQ